MWRGTLHLCCTPAKAALLHLSLVLSCFQTVPPMAFYDVDISTQPPSTPPARLEAEREEKLAAARDEPSGELTAATHLAGGGGRGGNCFLLFFALSQNMFYKTLTICAGGLKFCILNAERQLLGQELVWCQPVTRSLSLTEGWLR